MLSVVIACVYAVPYAIRVRHLRARGRRVPKAAIAAYAAALACLIAAGLMADRTLPGHMAEHLLLGDIAPLLLVLGCTGPILAPLLRRGRRLHRLGHPVLALGLWASDLWAWHLPGPYAAAVHTPAVHALQHGCFLLFGVVAWQSLVGPLPTPAWFTVPVRLGWIAAWWMLGSAVGAVLVFSGRAVYAPYPDVGGQSAAGALMMVEQSAVAVGLFCVLFLTLFRERDSAHLLRHLEV